MKRNIQKSGFWFASALLLPFAVLLSNDPAQAAKLQGWRFNTVQNQLEFSTDEGVQPRAQLIANPTRLVVDLPGTNLGRPAVTENYSGAVKAVRVGQFERGITRLVMELAPGYTIDPTQVRFRPASAQQWSVQLPTPRLAQAPNPGDVIVPIDTPPQVIPVPPAPTPVTPRPTPAPSPVVPRPTPPKNRPIVVIDPGHGGPDPGAVGIGGLQEKRVVLDISQQIAALLEKQGVQVVMSRSADVDLDLAPRTALANRVNANAFVSIHANAISMSRQDISGLETYYYNTGANLARSIHQSVLQETGVRDRGVRTARFYVLRYTSMPSVLVEVGFVTGREDAAKLATPAYRTKMAGAIANGVLRYLGIQAKR